MIVSPGSCLALDEPGRQVLVADRCTMTVVGLVVLVRKIVAQKTAGAALKSARAVISVAAAAKNHVLESTSASPVEFRNAKMMVDTSPHLVLLSLFLTLPFCGL